VLGDYSHGDYTANHVRILNQVSMLQHELLHHGETAVGSVGLRVRGRLLLQKHVLREGLGPRNSLYWQNTARKHEMTKVVSGALKGVISCRYFDRPCARVVLGVSAHADAQWPCHHSWVGPKCH
jgi:hypothetical protein